MTYQLPILYTVWPVDKPLPEDLEYVVDHEIFKSYPDLTTSSVMTSVGPYPIRFATYDNVLQEYVPLYFQFFDRIFCLLHRLVFRVGVLQVSWLDTSRWKSANCRNGKAGLDKSRPIWLNGEYSPLFIDLTDDYNQLADDVYYPDDEIKNVPASVIWSIVSTSESWTVYRWKLQSYVGTGAGKYYTSTEFNNWIENFDEWLDYFY